MDQYSNNPFRILSLSSTASVKDAHRSADKLLKWLELGETPQVDWVLPFLAPVRLDRDIIKWAVREIEDPARRLRHELFCPSGGFSYYEPCQKFLRVGSYTDFIAHCELAVSKDPGPDLERGDAVNRLDASLGRHYLAVFYHAAAIEGARKATRTSARHMPPPTSWERAFGYWVLVQKDDVFWNYLRCRAHELCDPRLKPEQVLASRQNLLRDILAVNVALGLEAMERGDYAELISQSRIIQASPSSAQVKTGVQEELATPFRLRFEKARREVQPKLSSQAIAAHSPIRQALTSGMESEVTVARVELQTYLAEIEDTINKKIVPIANQVKELSLYRTEAGVEILDGTAYILRSLSLAMNNEASFARQALRVTRIARNYATSEECREKLSEDERTLKFLAAREEALQRAEERQFRESLAKLEEALQFAETEQDKQTMRGWMEQARRLLAFEGLEPIDSAPSLSTINGIGTTLYGKREFDPQTQSYIATLYFTFFFIPIFPIAAYRVIDAGGGSYRFLGKAPLGRGSIWYPLVVPAIVLLIWILGALAGSSETPQRTSPSARATTARPSKVPPGPQSADNEKQRLSVWIERERTRLHAEKAELDRIGTDLDAERGIIRGQMDDVNRRIELANQVGTGWPSQYEIDATEDARMQFNKRVAGLNARARRYDADVQHFNDQIQLYNAMR